MPRSTPLRLLMSLLLCLLYTQSALAMDCSSETAEGFCLDAGTFQWCEEGELKSAKCPEGQICVSDNPFYDGAGCISTDETACGDISEEGECTTANGVVWCDEGVPMVYACGDQSVCAWDDENGEYDCMPRMSMGADAENMPPAEPEEEEQSEEEPEEGVDPGMNISTEPAPEAPPEESGQSEDEKDSETQESYISPTVTPTPADESPSMTLDGSEEQGCQGGDTQHDLLIALMLSLALVLNRPRRRTSTNA